MSSTSGTVPNPSASAQSASTTSSDSQQGGGGGWLEGVKKAAVEQYDSFKAKDPETAAKIEGAVQCVTKSIDDFSISQMEKSAMQKMDDMMAKLEAEYQAEKKKAYNEWQYLKKEDGETAAEIRKSLQSSQEEIAQAKKSAIASMQISTHAARVKIQAKLEAEYAAAKKGAEANYNALKAADMKMAAKVEAGITEAETKLGIAKQSCISQYGKVLADVATELDAAQKEAADEYAKAIKDANSTVDAAKATAGKTAKAVKARSEADAAAAKLKATAIQSDMEKQMVAVKASALADCDKLQALNAAKAEEIEKKVRDAETKVAAAKKAAVDEYQKVLKAVTDNLRKLSEMKASK